MAPTRRRGRKPALPRNFLEDHDWKLEVKKREGGRKDKYWKNLKTGNICRSTKEVKGIMEADGIYHIEASTQAKGASCKTTVAKPEPTSPATKELSQEIHVATDVVPEQNAVVPQGDIIDNNTHGNGEQKEVVPPPPGDIIDNNAHGDGGQEEVAQEQQHHGRMRNFDLNIGLLDWE